MQAPAGELAEQDVARDHDLLRRGRDSLEAELGRDQALVHHTPGGERRLLAVVGDRDIEGACVLERGAHQVARGDGQPDRKSTRLNSSHLVISYAVFCLKKKKK